MKLILVLFFLSLLVYTSSAQNKFDVQHYRFELLLSDASDTIKGTATIRLLIPAQSSELALDLINISDKKGMTVISVSDSINPNTPIPFQHKNNKLVIAFPEKTRQPLTRTIMVRYQGVPADGLIISKSKFGRRTFFSDNWPDRARNWLPCNDDPGDKAPVEFVVTAPSHYQVISNGIQVEETNLPGNLKLTAYKEEIPLPTKIMVIGVAEFAVSHAGLVNNCIPVSSWVFAENKDQGFPDYAIGTDILDFYTRYIGPYPYKKLANVQSKTIFGGMENASAIFYFENSVNGKRDQESLFAHEIVHQWFGNMATEKSFAHIWLSEGFATYLTHIYIESKYGKDSLEKRMQKDRHEIIEFVGNSRRPVVDSTKNFMSLLNENSYQKGSWVLHMLRRQLGDSIFQTSIRRYYQLYAGKNADSKDLQKVFEMVSGKELAVFFRQWLYTGENPSLELTWNYDLAKKQVNIRIRQLQPAIFDLPLQVAIVDVNGKPKIVECRVNKSEHKYSFSFPAKPARLTIDPNTSLLVSATISEKSF